MAEKLNPETATARQVAELYATEQKLSVGAKSYGNIVAKYLGSVADEPGSALSIFTPDETGETILSKTFKSLDIDVDNPKQSMQALRQVGLRVARELPANSNILAFLPEEKPDTPKNIKIFGIKEPPKSVSEVSIKTDPKTMQEFFRQVIEISKDPKQEAAAMAVLFNMQNGLRPNAAGMLKTNSYYPDTRAIYIAADQTGAKGRRVNVPLNDIADAILQARLQDGKTSGGYFFVKPNGKPVKSGDMTEVLKQVKIDDLIFDSSRNKTFNSLAPEGKTGEVPAKRGASLLRNLHTKVAQRSGISFERIAYLQGRSLKAAAEGTTGEVTGYAQEYPGDLDPRGPDVRNANVVSTYFANAASDAGFEISEVVPPPSQRVGRATPGYEEFFKAPVIEDPAVDAETTRAANNIAAGGAEYVPYTDSQIEELKTAGLWTDEMQSRHDEFMAKQQGSTAGSALKKAVGTAAGVAGTIVSTTGKAAVTALPGVGFEMTRRELKASGMDPAQATGQAALEEANLAMGVVAPLARAGAEAVVEASREPFQEETGMKLTDKNLGRGLVSKITGGFSYSSGGFIEKRR
jgi:hypothetical protein